MIHKIRLLAAIILPLLLFSINCSDTGSKTYPTYPYGGDYNYDGNNNNDNNDYIVDYSGEWEGFMWEDFRSDYISLGKKKIAMRVNYRDSTWTSSGWSDWYKIDVLIDGRPAASTVEEIHSGGYIHLQSNDNSIDLDMQGYFRKSNADGNFMLDWDEKFKDQWDGETVKYQVWISGTYDLGHVKGAQWAPAWELFDTYGDGIWDLSDEIWEAATLEGLAHLDTLTVEDIRTPD
ncbi:MAG: hypothetical protein NTY09_02460 [bacterium]|nr:hypothetical protein [bacterium]